MSNARTHVGVEVGDGLVARFGDVLVLVADPGRHAEGTEELLDAVESTASGAEPPGPAVAFRLARIFAATDVAGIPPFGVAAPAEDGYVLLLHGTVWAEITGPDGVERLSGEQAVTWVDRIVKAPVDRLTMSSGDHPVSVDPRSDLGAGLVPGSGFILTSVGSTGTVDSAAGSWAGELRGAAAPAPVAGGGPGSSAEVAQPRRDYGTAAPAGAEAAAAVAEAAWALVEEAPPQVAEPEAAEPEAAAPEAAAPEAAAPEAVEPDPIEPDPVEPEAAATEQDAPAAEAVAETLLEQWDDEGGSTKADPYGPGADIAEPETADATVAAYEASRTVAAAPETAAPETAAPEAGPGPAEAAPASPEPVVAADPWSAQSQSGEAAYQAPMSSEPAPEAPSPEPAPAEPALAGGAPAQPVEAVAAPVPAGSAWDQPTTAQPVTADPAAAAGQFRWGADAAPAGDSAQVGAAPAQVGGVSPAQPGAWLIGNLVGTDGARLPLDRSYVLGREPEHDPAVLSGAATPVRLPDDENLISRVQSYITVDGGGQVSLRDASSANGTYVAAPGAPTWTRLGPDPVLLPPTWSLRVGNRVFTYVAGPYPS